MHNILSYNNLFNKKTFLDNWAIIVSNFLCIIILNQIYMTTVNLNRPHYQESINKVLAYIEEHYKESEINLNEIAEHSNFCKRHVHRLWHWISENANYGICAQFKTGNH